MEIISRVDERQTEYIYRQRETSEAKKTSSAPNKEEPAPTAKDTPAKPTRDEYIPEKPQASPGIYQPEQDEQGNPKIRFDQPEQDPDEDTAKADAPRTDAPEKEASGKKAERCTGNTDKVDREIEKLKKQQKELEQKIHREKDETKIEQLKSKLAQVELELRQKDNDAYRRQHTVFTQ